MSARSSRRELMRPVQLLGLAFGAAVFAFVVTIVSMGVFQAIPASSVQRAFVVGGVIAGVTFVVTLVVIALLLLAVDPAQVSKTVDRPVLLPDGAATDAAPEAPAPGAEGPDSDAPDAPR